MTAGLPGAGIGGVFYLVSALLMPFRQLARMLRGRTHGRAGGWRVALAQAGLALAIIASMWLTGMLLARATSPRAGVAVAAAAGSAGGTAVAARAHGNIIGEMALAFSFGSLALVLVGVQVLRLLVSREREKEAEEEGDAKRPDRVRSAAAVVLLAAALALAAATPLRAQAPAPPDPPAADTSAVADARALAASGRTDAAIAAYQRWLATHAEDAAAWRQLGRQLQRAGRLREAASALQRSLALAPDGATRTRLAAVRTALRPALEPLVGGSRDSDANQRLTAGLALDGAVSRGRIGVQATHTRVTPADSITQLVSSGGRSAGRGNGMGGGMGSGAATTTTLVGSGAGSSDALVATLRVRPTAGLSLDGFAGAARTAVPGAAAAFGPTARLRLRWRSSAGSPAVELRAASTPLDASALLLADHAWRDEVGAMLELPAGPFRLRALGRAGDVRVTGDANGRVALGGVVALPVSSAVELSAQYNRLGYSHAAPAGYFAPRSAETAEVGSYVETQLSDAVAWSADLGAGVSRLARFGQPAGTWGPALRAWSMLSWTVAPGRELRLEGEAYDTKAGEAVAAVPAESWRYASLSLSMRVAIP